VCSNYSKEGEDDFVASFGSMGGADAIIRWDFSDESIHLAKMVKSGGLEAEGTFSWTCLISLSCYIHMHC
jgi:hypothetical protein